ncbi:MAG: cytochrome-c oxidase, cbb3-type subunit III [Magnetococcales bacterium]|nr:cytochrome-c oxidase, cbb3-type subunit III [Magnetococcales bacterium]MBF0151232.1 cytochrome-c oxidase, cbb3-type subunit III [Magnetococcales bacterium]MBF0175003.1 cytochrome-c oxidase, cbb3-type subunit III [Magnetococcales bacterium]MBF0348816.1 cytochrome-c oxidase, cbb3-type subunit III [Magnetococcales bacterium]
MSEERKVDTTGHQWDEDEGYPLQEYNNPLPRWWLYSFYATIVWAVVYWFLYPAWPLVTDFTRGMLGWSMHGQLQEELAQAQIQQKPFNDNLEKMSLADITHDPQLLQYAISGGKAIFGDHCAPCHGSGGTGSRAGGFPVLVDDDWLISGTIEGIHETIKGGHTAMMPAHLVEFGGAFKGEQVEDLVQFVLSLTNRETNKDAVARGAQLYRGEAGCNGCHGDHGQGSARDTLAGQPMEKTIGAPNLTDAIWLYGGDEATIRRSIAKGRNGQMPAWSAGTEGMNRKLEALAIKQVAVYVHSLGGGQ